MRNDYRELTQEGLSIVTRNSGVAGYINTLADGLGMSQDPLEQLKQVPTLQPDSVASLESQTAAFGALHKDEFTPALDADASGGSYSPTRPGRTEIFDPKPAP